MIKHNCSGLAFMNVALRSLQQADEPFRLLLFWTALNGADPWECEEFTQVQAAQEYFHSDEYLLSTDRLTIES
jgi:hypothetical protein